VRRGLKKLNLESRVAVKKPFLSAIHRERRLLFAKKYKSWTAEDWKRVIWCDESTFEIGKNSRQTRVRREPHEKYLPECLAPTFKSGRSSLMIWGAIAGEHKSELVFMEKDRRTAADYVDIVYRGPLLDMMRRVSGAVLMEDREMIHRSKVSNAWRKLYMIEKLEWPAQSPDLNPIENLWMQMKDIVQKRNSPVRTFGELRDILEEAWKNISAENCATLVESMPARIASVIKNKGGSTRW